MSKLGELAEAAELATDAHTAAVDAVIEAEAAYLRKRHIAYARTDENWSETKRNGAAEQAAYEELIALKAAKWAVIRERDVMRTKLATLSAAQTHYKSIDRQT